MTRTSNIDIVYYMGLKLQDETKCSKCLDMMKVNFPFSLLELLSFVHCVFDGIIDILSLLLGLILFPRKNSFTVF